MSIAKEERKAMKTFQLNKKDDYIFYLYQLLCRIYRVLKQQERYLKQANEYISNVQKQNILKTPRYIDVPYENYSDMLALLGHTETHLLNLTGDMQDSSLSYYKFRDIIKNRKKRKVLGFEIRDISSDVSDCLKKLNKERNFQNHEPESLITAEQKLIAQKELQEFNYNPIFIINYETCTLEFYIDMYNSYKGLNEIGNRILESIKLDYQDLLKQPISILEVISEKGKGMEHLEPVKLAAKVQGM